MSAILIIVAIVMFVLDTFGVKPGGVPLQSLGLAFWAAAYFDWPPLRRP